MIERRSPKVSVIVPIYNAEKYIEKSARSLFEQTLGSIEYIFIDDCGTDKSIPLLLKILEEYPHRKSQVKIIYNPKNAGVGQSRQKGIYAAEGEFLIHCDPDDWVEMDMYETLYDSAKSTNAEIAVCDYYNEYWKRSVIKKQTLQTDRRSIFHSIATEQFHSALWNKLIARDLAKKGVIEREINHWEDVSIVPYMMLKANKIVKVDKAFYHYNVHNAKSITNSNILTNAISSINAVKSLVKKLGKEGFTEIIDPNDIYRLQWSAKKGLIFNGSKENIRMWNNIFTEGHQHYNKIGLSLKMRLLTFLAKHNCYRTLTTYKLLKYIV